MLYSALFGTYLYFSGSRVPYFGMEKMCCTQLFFGMALVGASLHIPEQVIQCPVGVKIGNSVEQWLSLIRFT